MKEFTNIHDFQIIISKKGIPAFIRSLGKTLFASCTAGRIENADNQIEISQATNSYRTHSIENSYIFSTSSAISWEKFPIPH